MKIVRIDGGLGNQMFCYAFAIALREVSGEEVLIDTHRYKFFPNHFGYELSNLFNISLKEATNWQLWKVTNVAYNIFTNRIIEYLLPRRGTDIKEDFAKVDFSILDAHPDGYYIGNWQWYKYFERYRSLVLEELSFKEGLDNRNDFLYQQLLSDSKSVSLHVRRGDYLLHPKYCGICEKDYYSRAIERANNIVGGEPNYVIFSNDINWCRENLLALTKGGNVIFVDWNTGQKSNNDMRLMSACRINIIANSSFSWWAAYMNERIDKHVIAPDTWINIPMNYRIQCDDWECI